ncbi:MAG TPA: DUF167 domain-containing protein [Gemmatimonadaceae bacterium]|nr:DUF167 domain-containing protein [Gemmatimonadaceae bacterium]
MSGSGKAKVPRATRIEVRVQPRASSNQVIGYRDGVLRVRVQASPIDGAANDALVRLLADEFGVARRQVRIVSGFGSRNKIVEVGP